MGRYKKILLYLLLFFFITIVNIKLTTLLGLLLILSIMVDKISKLYYIPIVVSLLLIILVFNLYDNSTEFFLVMGVGGFLLKKYFIKVLKVKDKLTEASKKNTYKIWSYTIVMSMESIGIYGFLGYNYFLYTQSTLGLLKVLILAVLYNYSQSSFVIKDN